MSEPIDWNEACFFLGAGFSFEMGMPLVCYLTTELTDWLTPEKLVRFNEGWKSQGGGYDQEAIDYLISMLTDDSCHYEQMIGQLNGRYLETRSESFRGLAAWLTDMVCYLLFFRHGGGENARKLANHAHFYQGFIELAARRTSSWVFSLNHDLCVELIADKHQYPWSTGFLPEIVTVTRWANQRELQFRRLEAEGLKNGELHYGDRGINLLKLHGSLDFFVYDDRKCYLGLAPDDTGAVRMEALAELYAAPEPGAKLQGEIAVADRAGEMQFLRHTLLSGAHKFQDRLTQNAPKELLDCWVRKMEEHRETVVIGYSFCDEHINGPLRDWLAGDAGRRLTIVGPVAELPAGWDSLAAQVRLVREGAIEFLDTEAGIRRQGNDLQQLRMLRIARKIGAERMKEVMERARAQKLDDLKERIVAAIQRGALDNEDPDEFARKVVGTTDEALSEYVDLIEAGANS